VAGASVVELRFVEVRTSGKGRIIEGTAVPYGVPADMPWGQEVIERGAFGDLNGSDLILNVLHDRHVPLSRTGAGLTVFDSNDGLSFRAEIVQTKAGDDALELVRTGILRGASIEFGTVRDSYAGELRRVHEATLFGVALADRPAYPDALVEVRTRALPVNIRQGKGEPWLLV